MRVSHLAHGSGHPEFPGAYGELLGTPGPWVLPMQGVAGRLLCSSGMTTSHCTLQARRSEGHALATIPPFCPSEGRPVRSRRA